jgi:predicted component of type VI protein secretion system
VHSPAALAPTHIVFGGRAWRLASGPVQIGTELGESEHGIRLDGRAHAVSRRHCAIALEDGRVVVHDQSRYGTFLNGHRIEGSAVLHAGDVLRVGQPPLEFALIAEVERGT